MDDCGFPPKEDEIEMGLKARIRLSQSKKAWTQYVTIPSAVVQDSQYTFKGDEDLYLEVEPSTGIMVISRRDKQLKVTKDGLLVMKSREEYLLEETESKGVEQEVK
jgi:hypothetical protein